MKNPFKARLTKKRIIELKALGLSIIKNIHWVVMWVVYLLVIANEFILHDIYESLVYDDNDVTAYLFMIVLLVIGFMKYDKFVAKKVNGGIDAKGNNIKSNINK